MNELQRMRPVMGITHRGSDGKVREREGRFHGWYSFADNGAMEALAIVEFDDGTVGTFAVNNIRFTDTAAPSTQPLDVGCVGRSCGLYAPATCTRPADQVCASEIIRHQQRKKEVDL